MGEGVAGMHSDTCSFLCTGNLFFCACVFVFEGQINIIALFPRLGLLKYGNSFQLSVRDLAVPC